MFEIEWIKDKSVYRNLILIKGVSTTLAKNICALIGVSPNTLYSNLLQHKRDQLNHLISKIKKNFTPFNLSNQNTKFNPILVNLEEFRKKNVTNLITLNSLRGRRIKQGYPAHGQRTRSNGKTAKRLNRSFAK